MEINLEKLNIRIRGFSSAMVQLAINDLKNEIRDQIKLEKISVASIQKMNGNVSHIDAGVHSVRTGKNSGPSDLRQAIASQVSKAIVSGISSSKYREGE